MGQRLIITVRQNQKDIAKVYYHWSAYTFSALNEARLLVNECICSDSFKTKDMRLRLIHYLESKGGGIDGGLENEEGKYICSLYPDESFSANSNRNCGLIAISEKGMKDLQVWSEGDLTIDIDTQTVQNRVYFIYESLDELNEERKEWMEEDYVPLTVKDITEAEKNPEVFSFDEIDDHMKMLRNKEFISYNNRIYSIIE